MAKYAPVSKSLTLPHTMGSMAPATYPVDQIENQPHGHAELFKVEAAIIVDVGEVPDPLQLIVAEVTVLQDRRSLCAVEKSAAVGQRREDFPVLLDLSLLDAFVRHGCGATDDL